MDRRVKREDGVLMRTTHEKTKCVTPDGSSTLLQILQNMAMSRPSDPFLGTIIDNRVIYKTYAEVLQAATRLACFFESVTKEHDTIGLYSVNRVEWIIGEYASYLSNCKNCPIFSTFSPESLQIILGETELKVLVASADKARSLIKTVLSAGKHSVTHIVLMDDDRGALDDIKKLGIKGYLLSEIIRDDRGYPQRQEPRPEDIATICYTSGTSGIPKGVILTHRNFLAAVSGFVRSRDPLDIPEFKTGGTYISYLPLPHVLERICFTISFASGIKISFFRGNAREIQKDCKIIKPTFFVAVPRVLNVIKEKIDATINQQGFFVRLFFKVGLCYKRFLQRFCVYDSWLFDKFIFSKIAAEFGGRLNCCLCGGASLNPRVQQYIEAVFSMKVIQGYGQTEGLAANIILPMDVNDNMSVGIPFPGIQVKINLLPEYGEGIGELMMRGALVSQGYYKRPEETKKTFVDGWLCTGDLAREKNGRFYIVGRIKEVFKTSFGEYIVPEVLENHFTGGIIEDIFITNSRFSDFLLAVVVCTDTSVTEDNVMVEIKKRAERLIADKKIMRYEVPSCLVLVREPFIFYENGELITPSLKKRRNRIQEYFKSQIESAFKKVE